MNDAEKHRHCQAGHPADESGEVFCVVHAGVLPLQACRCEPRIGSSNVLLLLQLPAGEHNLAVGGRGLAGFLVELMVCPSFYRVVEVRSLGRACARIYTLAQFDLEVAGELKTEAYDENTSGHDF